MTTIVKRETLHISDDTGRIALIDTRTSGTGTEPVQLLRYQYSNHLQSASLELDASGAIISYEEYYPYGSTSFQSGRSSAEVSLKRYRYTGKERDEESGLYYHGARYYIPWLARWSAVDPLESKYAGMSPYNYSFNNPVMFNDPSGMGPEEVYKLDEVVIQGTRPEGAKKETQMGLGGYSGRSVSTTEYWHNGDQKNSSGWYSESDFVRINKDVMLGLIASQDPEILMNSNPGIKSAISQVANSALDFLERNEGNISPNFINLLSSHAGELASEFREAHGDAIYPSAFDPIADLLPAIVLGLGKALVDGGKMVGGKLVAGSIEASVAGSPNIALESVEITLEKLSTLEIGTTRMRLLNSASNPKLIKTLEYSYRENAKILSGSTGDAIRYELSGGGFSGTTSHLQKGKDLLNTYRDLLKGNKGPLNVMDRNIIFDQIDDLTRGTGLQWKGLKYDYINGKITK